MLKIFNSYAGKRLCTEINLYMVFENRNNFSLNYDYKIDISLFKSTLYFAKF